MQVIAAITGDGIPIERQPTFPVQWIADQRIARRRAVYADLMWSPGGNVNLQQGAVFSRVAVQDVTRADRGFSVRCRCVDHSERSIRDRADRGGDDEVVGHIATRDQSEISFPDASITHCCCKNPGGIGISGTQYGAAGAAAEPVYRRKRGSVAIPRDMQQCIPEKTAAWKDGQSSWFVQDNTAGTFPEDGNPSRRVRLHPWWAMPTEAVAGKQRLRGIPFYPAIPFDASLANMCAPLLLRRMAVPAGIIRQQGLSRRIGGYMVVITITFVAHQAHRRVRNTVYREPPAMRRS